MANEVRQDPNSAENNNTVDPPNERILESFSSYTTLHGFHFVFSSDASTFRRVFWVILMLAGFAGLTYQIYLGILKVQAHETVTSTEIQSPETLIFPAISICNMNIMKKSKIAGTEAQTFLDQFDPIKMYFYGNRIGSLSASFDIERAVREYGHNISTMLYKCTWQSNEFCGPQNFSTFFSGEFGLCYTINSGSTGHRLLDMYSPGRGKGLVVTLNAEPDEYYGPFSYGGTGFRIYVHDQLEADPNIELKSAIVSPGYSYEVRITRREAYHLPAPYKSECGERQLQTFKTYSFGGCLRECYTRATTNRCGCRTLGMVIGGTLNVTRHCSPAEMINCSFAVLTRMNPNSCECPRECKEITYDSHMSFSHYPSEHVWTTIFQALNVSEKYLRLHKEAYRKKYARITFFYETLQTDVTRERPAYTLSDLSGDVGGNMGLFLGCSIITLCEFLDLMVRLCFSRNRRVNKVVKINESYNTK